MTQFAVTADTGAFGAGGSSGVRTVIKLFEVDVLYTGWLC